MFSKFAQIMKRYVFPFLVGIIALSLAVIAGFFSITGMANIFPGWSTLVMTSAIEAGKVISVSILYRMWHELKWLKWLLIPMTIVIMAITSIGVYGHLSSTYESTAVNMRTHDSEMKLGEKRKDGLKEKVAYYESAIERKQNRAKSLIELRGSQESRLDSLYARNQLRSAREVQGSIVQANKEIEALNLECDSMSGLINKTMLEISGLDSVMITKESMASGGEAGTIKFMARVTGWSTDSTANLFMLMLISVFDPLSIILLIVFNMAMDRAERENGTTKSNKKEIEKDVDIIGNALYDVSNVVEKEDGNETLPEKNEITEEDKVNEEVPVITSESIKDKRKVSEEELYTSLLYILYNNGRLVENDHLDLYDVFVDKVRNSNISCDMSDIDSFLQRCVDLKVIKIGKKDRVALKSYKDALKAVKDGAKK